MVIVKQQYNIQNVLFSLTILFLLWGMISLYTQMTIIVSPISVLQKIFVIFYPTLVVHSVYSLGRMMIGIIIAIITGVSMGIGMGYFKILDKFFSPIVYMTYPIPKIALLPILMVLCGLGEVSKVMMIVLIILFQVIIGVRDGVKDIAKEIYEPLISVGATHKDIILQIVLPACLPKLFTSLRIAMATAISVLFFTETFGTTYGMGFFIMDAWMRVNYIEMYAGIMVLSFIGFALFFTFDVIEKKCCGWLV